MRVLYIHIMHIMLFFGGALHAYALLDSVETVCERPRYEEVRKGVLYIWSKCDVLRAITTYERDRQAFSQVLVADVMHVANNILKLVHQDALSSEQQEDLRSLTQQLSAAYADAFGASSNASIDCTQRIFTMLDEVYASQS